MDELIEAGAQALLAALASGTISAEELMRATLERVARENPRVNALVSLRPPEEVLAEARAADATRARGSVAGVLHGLPMAIKDLSNVAGMPTSRGSPLFAGQIAESDELFVARLRAAGAIFIGKTNTPEFGLGGHTFNTVFGATRNPYDLTRSAGGSSGGAATALASGMVALADGSDMMGSLRNPAAWNNLYGFRTSWGLVPDTPAGETFLHPVATVGPMARNPRDLALLLSVISGPVAARPFCLPSAPFPALLDAPVTGRRIGWLGDWGGVLPMEPGILDLCEAALAQMEGLGLEVERLAPPFPAADIWEAWTILRAFAVTGGLGPLHDDPGKRARMKASARWEVEKGRSLSLADVERASLIRSNLFAALAALFARVDALALPSAQVWPFPVEREYPTEIAGRDMDTYHRWMEVVVPASLTGLPCLSVPVGFGGAGLPMGMQLIGPHGGDAGLLQLAEAWHMATDWPGRRPPPRA